MADRSDKFKLPTDGHIHAVQVSSPVACFPRSFDASVAVGPLNGDSVAQILVTEDAWIKIGPSAVAATKGTLDGTTHDSFFLAKGVPYHYYIDRKASDAMGYIAAIKDTAAGIIYVNELRRT